MLIYNTTYHVEEDQEKVFLIWLNEQYIPNVLKEGTLKEARLLKVLSHQDEGASYSLQFEVENSSLLHKWYTSQGALLSDELSKIFKDKVVGFPTLMEVCPLV